MSETDCPIAGEPWVNKEGWFKPTKGKYKGQDICIDWDYPCTKCMEKKND